MSDDDLDQVVSLHDFFICREYSTKSLKFGDYTVHYDALDSAATDFDLTGQVLWTAARLTTYFLASSQGQELIRGKPIIELGAGCGLCGLLATQMCPEVVFTDNEPEVLKILELNMKHTAPGCKASVVDLDWGSEKHHAELEERTGRKRWPVVVGADVVFWSVAIKPLFQSVSKLLAADGVFILGFMNRRNGLQDAIEEEAENLGLNMEKLDIPSFVPETASEVLDYVERLTLYLIKWKPGKEPATE